MAAGYAFRTRWRTTAPPADAWRTLVAALDADPGRTWWRGVEIASAASGAPRAGDLVRMAVRSPLGMRMRLVITLTDVEPGRMLAGTAAGDLHGVGRVMVEPVPGGSVVVIVWEVEPARRWWAAWPLRPAAALAHTLVMRRGGRAFRQRAGMTD